MKFDLEDMAILRMPDVIRLTGLGRSSIYQMMADGKFPRKVLVRGRLAGWFGTSAHGYRGEILRRRKALKAF